MPYRLRRPEAKKAESEARGRRALVVGGDLTDSAAVNRMAARFEVGLGSLTVRVNGTGGRPKCNAPIWDVTSDEWDAVINRNLRSEFFTVRACVPMLKASGKGRSFNMSSVTERTGGFPGSSACSAAKGGVIAFTRALTKELAPTIRVNAASLGLVDSPFHSQNALPIPT